MFKKASLTILALVVVLFVAAGYLNRRRVDSAIEELATLLPYDITLSSAKRVVAQRYPLSEIYRASECESRRQQESPRPPPLQGGSCIFGITKVENTNAKVTFRLFFGPDETLKIRFTRASYTSL